MKTMNWTPPPPPRKNLLSKSPVNIGLIYEVFKYMYNIK